MTVPSQIVARFKERAERTISLPKEWSVDE